MRLLACRDRSRAALVGRRVEVFVFEVEPRANRHPCRATRRHAGRSGRHRSCHAIATRTRARRGRSRGFAGHDFASHDFTGRRRRRATTGATSTDGVRWKVIGTCTEVWLGRSRST